MINIKNIKITPQMLSQIAEVELFKGTWTAFEHLQPEQLKALRKTSTIESVGSSNRIEGNKLSDAEVEKLLSRIDRKSFKSRDEEEVAGYAKLMDIIFDDYEVIPLSENYIKQLHRVLLQHVGKDEKHRGEYKKFSNSVTAYDANGKEMGIVFETAEPFDTPRLMTELVEWTQRNLNDPFLHPLIVIGVFIVHFLAVHPFQDGNGRLSRLLSTLLLLKNGYKWIQYVSFEHEIESRKSEYYQALRACQTQRPNEDITIWINFFLNALRNIQTQLMIKLEQSGIETQFSPREKAILTIIQNYSGIKSSEIADKLNIPNPTVKRILSDLQSKGMIEKQGSSRSTVYLAKVK